MKAFVIMLLALQVFFASIAFSAGAALNGHEWKEQGQAGKAAYMLGFLTGYMKGRGGGRYETISEMLRWFDDEICQDRNESACLKLREIRDGKGTLSLNIRVVGFEESNVFYVKELDAFYEAFPLCRGKAVSEILDQLSGVWATPRVSEISYGRVGTDCAKSR